MYGMGIGLFNLHGLENFPKAYYSESIKYREGNRKKVTNFNILPADGKLTVTQTTHNDSIMGFFFAKTVILARFNDTDSALQYVKDAMTDTIKRHNGTLAHTHSPGASQIYQWLPLQMLGEDIKNNPAPHNTKDAGHKPPRA